ncbi:MAG: hypothetical protein NTW29_12500 [Bacteroidetes bacterium]|nr:hypothetical protein [Bacteroidota bacterium]
MKKLLIILVITITGLNYSQAQDFRGLSWGSSLDTVQDVETSRLLSNVNNDELIYKDILGGSDCEVIYLFNDNDKLISGMYLFTKKYSNPQLYIQDYNKFKDLLTKKYGKATSDVESWAGNVTPKQKLDYGQAVSTGMLSLSATWNTGRSVIKIVLAETNDHKPGLQIHYTSASLDQFENSADLNESLKKL